MLRTVKKILLLFVKIFMARLSTYMYLLCHHYRSMCLQLLCNKIFVSRFCFCLFLMHCMAQMFFYLIYSIFVVSTYIYSSFTCLDFPFTVSLVVPIALFHNSYVLDMCVHWYHKC